MDFIHNQSLIELQNKNRMNGDLIFLLDLYDWLQQNLKTSYESVKVMEDMYINLIEKNFNYNVMNENSDIRAIKKCIYYGYQSKVGLIYSFKY